VIVLRQIEHQIVLEIDPPSNDHARVIVCPDFKHDYVLGFERNDHPDADATAPTLA
jgi:hypothetical protein